MTEVVGPPRRPCETVPTAMGVRVTEGSLSYGTESARSWAETDEFRGRCLFLLKKVSMAVNLPVVVAGRSEPVQGSVWSLAA